MTSVTAGGATSKRRRFQTPITNYFLASTSGSESRSNLSSNHQHAPPAPTLNPTLPDKIQSSLLQVGMRVRKAVPEGYKTTEKTTKLAPHINRAIHYPPALSTTTNSESTRAATELMPLCGMFKVGNFGMQTVQHRQWDVDSFALDQESFGSAPNPGKRGRKTDLDSDEEDSIPQFNFPNTAIHSHPRQNSNPMRKILTPKLGQQGRSMAFRPAKWNQSHCGALHNDQENQSPLPPGPAADFEDAVFLRRREEVDPEFNVMTTEVEMSGV